MYICTTTIVQSKARRRDLATITNYVTPISQRDAIFEKKKRQN